MARKSSSSTGKARNATSSRAGQTLSGSATCPFCTSRVQGEARYCQNCGKSLHSIGWLSPQTLTVLASAVIALVALGLLFASVIDFERSSSTNTTAATSQKTAVSGQPPDLSEMTPREAADRLFNRVMMADEQGNAAEVERFTPMAVSAYEMLESLDSDALFHVGLIHAAAGEIEEARNYAERLKAVAPNHLLAALLDHRLAEADNNATAAAAAASRFHDHYDEEISIGRPEYEHHRTSIARDFGRISRAAGLATARWRNGLGSIVGLAGHPPR